MVLWVRIRLRDSGPACILLRDLSTCSDSLRRQNLLDPSQEGVLREGLVGIHVSGGQGTEYQFHLVWGGRQVLQPEFQILFCI